MIKEVPVQAEAPVDVLLEAKQRSDRKDYGGKRSILESLIHSRPNEFEMDSSDGRGIVGVTHTPTGFRFHMPESSWRFVKGGQ